MRILGLTAFVLPFVVFACVGSESSAPPASPDSGSLPDRTAPPNNPDTGTGTGETDSGLPDTGTDSTPVSTCPIANDATVAAKLEMSVDDQFKLYVNGALVKEFTGTWDNVQPVDVTLNRNP